MDFKAKIDAALALEGLWEGYQVTVSPTEIIEYVKQLPPRGRANSRALVRLIEGIEATLKRRHIRHVFHVGKAGGRLMTVDLFKRPPRQGKPKPWLIDLDYEALTWPVMKKFQSLAGRAGCNRFDPRLSLGIAIFHFGWSDQS